MKTAWIWVIARLKEPSTWAGIGIAATAAAAALQSKSGLVAAVIAAVVAFAKSEQPSA